MALYEVVERRFWRNKINGMAASLYGAVPYATEQQSQDWEIVSSGYTIRFPDGTIHGNPYGGGYTTEQEAQAIVDKLNARHVFPDPGEI